MAPTPHKQDLTTNLFSSNAPNLLTTMSSPNLNAASILRNQSTRTTNSFSSASTNLSGMKTVYVGKDQHPVTIMQMAHVNEVVWKKAASFENLCNTAQSLLEAHSTADIMALIAKEIPMDTGAAFQEAQVLIRSSQRAWIQERSSPLSSFYAAGNLSFNIHIACYHVEARTGFCIKSWKFYVYHTDC